MPLTRLEAFPHEALTRLVERVAAGDKVELEFGTEKQATKYRYLIYEWRKVMRRVIEKRPELELLLPLAEQMTMEVEPKAGDTDAWLLRVSSSESGKLAEAINAALEG